MAFWCGPEGVGGNHGVEERHESLRSAHRDGVNRMTDDVGVNMFGKVKPNRKAARAAALRVVIYL